MKSKATTMGATISTSGSAARAWPVHERWGLSVVDRASAFSQGGLWDGVAARTSGGRSGASHVDPEAVACVVAAHTSSNAWNAVCAPKSASGRPQEALRRVMTQIDTTQVPQRITRNIEIRDGNAPARWLDAPAASAGRAIQLPSPASAAAPGRPYHPARTSRAAETGTATRQARTLEPTRAECCTRACKRGSPSAACMAWCDHLLPPAQCPIY